MKRKQIKKLSCRAMYLDSTQQVIDLPTVMAVVDKLKKDTKRLRKAIKQHKKDLAGQRCDHDLKLYKEGKR